jgi:hypothetical protein
MMLLKPPHLAELLTGLAFGWLGAIGRASAFTFAAIFSRMLGIAAALTLTVILAFAGVLGQIRRGSLGACLVFAGLVLHQGAGAVVGSGLCVEASSGAAEQTCECSRQY